MYSKNYNRYKSHRFLNESELNGLCPKCGGGVSLNAVGMTLFCLTCGDKIGELINKQ